MTPIKFTPLGWSLALCLAGLVVAMAVWHVIDGAQEQAARERFDDLAARAEGQLIERMHLYQYGVKAMRGAIITMGEQGISRERVLRYSASRDFDKEFPGSRGFGFIRRVPIDQLDAFLTMARADGKPDFELRQLSPHDHERLIIQYIEPVYRNQQAVGLDIASEANRRNSALKSIRSGDVTLTHPITLVQASGKVNRGFLMMAPTYRGDTVPDNEAGRIRSAYGLAYTPLVMDEILQDFDFRDGEFSMTIEDRSDSGDYDLFYESLADQTKRPAGLTATSNIELFGRQWQIRFIAERPFFVGLNQLSLQQYLVQVALLLSVFAVAMFLFLRSKEERRLSILQNERLAAIVSGSNDAIIGLTLDGVVTDWNAAAEEMFGYQADAMLGQPVRQTIVPDALKDEAKDLLNKVIAGGIVHNHPSKRKNFDGEEFDVSLTIFPIRNETGSIIGLAKTIRDISEAVAAQNQINRLNQELERKVEERTDHLEVAVKELVDFSYLASHDLRTPLRAIDGFSNLIMKSEACREPQVAGYLDRIRKAAQKMGHVIDDILSLTDIARAKFDPTPVDLTELAQIESTKIAARYPDHSVQFIVQPGMTVRADKKLLQILLAQVLDNAWKFTRNMAQPMVELSGELQISEDAKNTMLLCRLSDNGVGFDMQYVSNIFKPFQKLHTDELYSGNGIGLALAVRVVRKHGGEIRAESQVGEGTRVLFSLPTEN